MVPRDLSGLVEAHRLEGDDEEDAGMLRGMLVEATNYITSHRWCRGIKASYFGFGVGGIVAVFLFEIVPGPGADEFVWVVVGDLPPLYITSEGNPTPCAAMNGYVQEMRRWGEAVRTGGPSEGIAPVAAPARPEYAERLSSRLQTLEESILPKFCDER
jgi:hypothetical protein